MTHTRQSAEHAQSAALAKAPHLDMADWSQAPPATYFDNVSKTQLIQPVTQACGADAAKSMATQMKAEAVSCEAAKLEGQRWLPTPAA